MPHRPTRRWTAFLAAGLAAALTALLASAMTAAPARAEGLPGAQSSGPRLATRVVPNAYYGSPVRDRSGRIDPAATVAALRSRGVRNYEYLVANNWGFDSAADWSALPAFLTVARRAGVTVEVILLPPSEASFVHTDCNSANYPPYRGSYGRWAQGIGALARTHPNLIGWGIDDFTWNTPSRGSTAICRTFTPGVVKSLRASVDRAAGRPVAFRPTAYLKDLTILKTLDPFVKAGVITEVVFPFTEIGQERTQLMRQITLVHGRYPKLRLHMMVCAQPIKDRPVPTASSVDTSVLIIRQAIAQKKAASSIVYQQALHADAVIGSAG